MCDRTAAGMWLNDFSVNLSKFKSSPLYSQPAFTMWCINEEEQSFNFHILNPAPPVAPVSRSHKHPPLPPSPSGLGGRWTKALCVCRTGDPLPLDLWPNAGACTEEALMRANLHLHCCELSWGLETRLRERQQHTDYKSKVSSEDRKWEHTHIWPAYLKISFLLAQNHFFQGFLFIYLFYQASFPFPSWTLDSIMENVNRHKNIYPNQARTEENRISN